MMRLEEEFVGKAEHFAELLRKIADQLSQGNLKIRRKQINLPDGQMEYKVSHIDDFGMHKLSISIEWLEKEK